MASSPNILYLHGFGSKFDPESNKVKELGRVGKVHGVDVDYTGHPDQLVSRAREAITSHSIDLLVGTSMGGWLSSVVSSRTGLPFVAINPALNPEVTLRAHIGTGVDYHDRPFTLTESAVSNYFPFIESDIGIVLLDSGDDLFNSEETRAKLNMHCVVYPGGSHRFEHMPEAVDEIARFYLNVHSN